MSQVFVALFAVAVVAASEKAEDQKSKRGIQDIGYGYGGGHDGGLGSVGIGGGGLLGGHGGDTGLYAGGYGEGLGGHGHVKTVTVYKNIAVPYPVEKQVPVPVEKLIPVPVKVFVPQPYPVHKIDHREMIL